MGNLKTKLGTAGEKAAVRFLKRGGFKVLARNYTCPLGELDIVAMDENAIVFVEVKTREHGRDADPELNIDARKRRKLTQVARYWLGRHREPDCAYRFDAVSVLLSQDREPEIRHVVDAFVPTS